MQKVILCVSLSGLILLSGCTSCQNNDKEIDNIFIEEEKKEITVKDKKAPKKANKEVAKKASKELPSSKSTFDVNITQEEDMEKSLAEVELSAINDIQPRIFEETQKIPECLENAGSKEEAFECSKSLRALNKDLIMTMGDFSEELPEEKGYDKDFIWNEETKIKMIQEIESGLQGMQTMRTCIESAKTPTDLDKCYDKPEHEEIKFEQKEI